MKEEIPYSKLIKLALITTPFFGILGAVPAFAMNEAGYSRILNSFAAVVVFSFIFWSINILLLVVFQNYRTRWQTVLRYVLSILSCTVVVLLFFEYIFRNNRPPLPANIQQLLDQQMPRPGKSGRYLMPAIQALSINIISLVLTELILLRNRKEKIETENARLRLANLEARHNQLKQQLHPHFLFNSLNTLKALIRKTPEQAEDYLIRLADLLRFSIYANKEEKVTVEKEIELCVNYLNMQQVRFGAALDYRIDIPDNILHTGLLPVYSVQLLAENAIKHNQLTVQQPLYIRITGDEKSGSITLINNLQPRLTVETGNGLGLSNLTERYRLLGKPGLSISRGRGEFSVTIKLLNDEYSNH